MAVKIKTVNAKSLTLFGIGIATIAFLLYFVISNAVGSQAKYNNNKAYYWCATYKYGQVVNRYCYGDSGQCQTYNLFTKRPKDDLKRGTTYVCYSDKVYVRRKGSPCPPDDYVIENAGGGSVGCFGGFKEQNMKILKK